MSEQKSLTPSIPSEAKILKEELKEKIAERIKQAEKMKVTEKAFFIAQQLGKKKIHDRFWALYNYVFKKGGLAIIAFEAGGWITIKFREEFVYDYDHGVDVFKPAEEWLKLLEKYYEKALKSREAEMKEKFGL